ncbi:SgcJ/EcaC family oxidoreductase [Nonomuraea sp. SYSU D8015]|uniref:SgcJ/EcaC family oxidoreductase n=1 Tax=Nonomuraea sp. SYSU D8015 TaxID=2593644 RepID=UPI001CB6C33E|nr:SgcJ/EcaC family oxidoreductase [Nonomuraea sp. SYSU D8015]
MLGKRFNETAIGVLLLMAAACGGAGAAEPTAGKESTMGQDADAQALGTLEQRQADAWDRGDGDAFAATFTEDADFIAVNGEHIRTRAKIAESMRAGLSTFMKGTRLRLGEERHVRFLSADTAIMITGNCVIRPGEDECRPEARSMQTRVAVKRDGAWLFTAFQNTRIGQPPA